MENESTDNRNYTTLRDFVARCLRKNKHLSADSLFRTGEEVPLPDLPLKLKDLDSVIDSIFADRFLRLIQDLADYGRRGIYEFEAEEKGPVYEQEERWLNGDLSDLGISPLRGKRSSRPETRMDRESFGSCLARLVKESAAKNLSRRSLEWLTSTFDYNLDWLFFGVGEMVHSTFQSIYEPAQMAHDEEGENGSVTHTVTYQTVADVKGMRGTTTWSGADWTWLLNGKSHTSFQCKAPTLPLAARCVSAWNVQPMTPDMPDLLPFIDRLYVWILHEFFEKKPLPKGDWRQELFLTLVRGKNKLLMLLGTTPQAGTQYRLGKALPGDSARKLAYLIEAIIRRYGRTGFLQYIDMVNDEAVACSRSSGASPGAMTATAAKISDCRAAARTARRFRPRSRSAGRSPKMLKQHRPALPRTGRSPLRSNPQKRKRSPLPPIKPSSRNRNSRPKRQKGSRKTMSP